MPQCTVSQISHFYAMGVLHLFIFSKFLPTVRPLCNAWAGIIISPTDGFEVIRDTSEGSNFQCYQQRCSRWFLAWYQWYRILHIMFNEKKRSQGALWMVTLFIILLLLLFCTGIFPYLRYFLAPQCAHSIGLRPSIHQTSRCWVAVTELCPPSMYSATAPTDSIHL